MVSLGHRHPLRRRAAAGMERGGGYLVLAQIGLFQTPSPSATLSPRWRGISAGMPPARRFRLLARGGFGNRCSFRFLTRFSPQLAAFFAPAADGIIAFTWPYIGRTAPAALGCDSIALWTGWPIPAERTMVHPGPRPPWMITMNGESLTRPPKPTGSSTSAKPPAIRLRATRAPMFGRPSDRDAGAWSTRITHPFQTC